MSEEKKESHLISQCLTILGLDYMLIKGVEMRISASIERQERIQQMIQLVVQLKELLRCILMNYV